jgi:hypothetical protein
MPRALCGRHGPLAAAGGSFPAAPDSRAPNRHEGPDDVEGQADREPGDASPSDTGSALGPGPVRRELVTKARDLVLERLQRRLQRALQPCVGLGTGMDLPLEVRTHFLDASSQLAQLTSNVPRLNGHTQNLGLGPTSIPNGYALIEPGAGQDDVRRPATPLPDRAFHIGHATRVAKIRGHRRHPQDLEEAPEGTH